MTDAELILAAGEALDGSSMHRGGLSDRNFNFLEGLRHKLEEGFDHTEEYCGVPHGDGIVLTEPERDWMDDIAGDLGVGP